MNKKIMFGILLSALSFSSFAVANAYPKGCRPVGFHFQNGKLILSPVSATEHIQSIYLIHNRSMHEVKFVAEKLAGQDFAPQYAQSLEPEQWGAFAISSKQLLFTCSAKDADMTAPISCEGNIAICQYPRAKFADHNSGTYWLKSAITMEEMVQTIAADGILLRW